MNWANRAWIDRPPSNTTEAIRFAYVALTRAERLLVLAIPSLTADGVTACVLDANALLVECVKT